jgi:hypothetical protein
VTTAGRPLLLVLADSLAFHGPERPEPADDPRLWPNVAATALGGRAELVAGTGWTTRHAWQALIDDPRTWAVLPGCRRAGARRRFDGHAALAATHGGARADPADPGRRGAPARPDCPAVGRSPDRPG